MTGGGSPAIPRDPSELARDVIAGHVVQRLRLMRNWSQRELAARASTSQAMVCRLECGSRELSPDLAAAMARAFELAPAELSGLMTVAYQRAAVVAAASVRGPELRPWEAALRAAGLVGLAGLASFAAAVAVHEATHA